MNSLSPAWDTAGIDTGAAIAAALATIRRNIDRFGDRYPDDTTAGGHYPPRPAASGVPEGGNRGWTTSFWPGMQWLAWELSGDEAFRDAAAAHAADFARRIDAGQDIDTHDLGFLYTLSCVTAWRLLGDAQARNAALRAAAHLMGRFLPSAGIIQAWGDLADPRQRGRTIIDSLMNLPLLTWAGQQTGDPRYADAVRRHAGQLREHMLRADDSTFHTFYWDAETGQPRFGATEQGAHDDSCWARGQAWAVYGFALGHRRLRGLGVAPLEVGQFELGDAIDETGDLIAELCRKLLPGDAAVLDHVVQKAGGQRRRIHLEAGDDIHHLDRMLDIRLAGAPADLRPGHVVAHHQLRQHQRIDLAPVLAVTASPGPPPDAELA